MESHKERKQIRIGEQGLTLIAALPVSLFCLSWSLMIINGLPNSSNAKAPIEAILGRKWKFLRPTMSKIRIDESTPFEVPAIV